MSEPKRVKFAHPQATRAPRWDAPKTSEYAFFKKLKKDIGGTKSRPLHKEDIQSKIIEANGQKTETSTYSSTFKCSNGILRSSSSSEKEGPSNQFAFLSPIGIESNNLGIQTSKGTSSGINQMSSLLCGNVMGFDQNLLPSPFAGAAKNLGNQYAEKQVFSVKRQRLHQLAADLFPEAGEWNSKGFDLVSALIGRLFPRGNETEYSSSKERIIDAEYHSPAFPQLETLEKAYARNASKIQKVSCWDDVSPKYQSGRPRERVLCKPRGDATGYSNSKGRIIDAEYLSPAFLKLDTLEKTSAQNASKIQDGSCWDDVFPNYQSSRPSERFLSKWDMTTSSLPCIKYIAETDFQDEEANYSCRVDGKSIRYTFPESDSSFCIFFQNGRYSGPDLIKQLNGFHAPNEPARGEAHTLLLSWDVQDDEGKNSYSTSGNSLDFACQQIMDDNLEEITTCPSSLCSDHSLDFLSRQYIHSTCTYMHDMGGNHQDDYAVGEADLFPLSLSLPSNHLTMGEDWDIFNHLENNNINFPQQDPPWCTSKDPGKKDDFEALLFSRGLDINLGWKYFPKSGFLADYSSDYHIFQFPFKEDLRSYAVEQDEETILCCSPRDGTLASSDGGLGILDWSSASFNVSLGKTMGHPLLLDYPDRVRSEENDDR